MRGERTPATMDRNSPARPWLRVVGLVAAWMLTSACTATIDGGDSAGDGNPAVSPPTGGGGGTTPPGGTGSGSQPTASGGSGSGTPMAPTGLPSESACSKPGSPGPRVLRRLTVGEFGASIRDLFADKAAPVAEVFNDLEVLGFRVDSSELRVKDLNADQLMTNAEAVASWAVTSKLQQLQQLATCSSVDANCANLFVKNFGRKAFRTALADGDARVANYSKLFMAEASFAEGASTVITAMLQSPYFLYRSELGAPGGSGDTITLTSHEVASSLAYLLTGTTPDDTLLKAADALQGANATALAKMIDEQAQRLLAPSGGDQIGRDNVS